MRDLADDALGIVDALGLDTVHVVGRSMGGTALILAVDHPDRVASVTFMSTTTGDAGCPARPPPSGTPSRRPPPRSTTTTRRSTTPSR